MVRTRVEGEGCLGLRLKGLRQSWGFGLGLRLYGLRVWDQGFGGVLGFRGEAREKVQHVWEPGFAWSFQLWCLLPLVGL